jgi:5-formyltetrahydrofolate cyclo-ligase
MGSSKKALRDKCNNDRKAYVQKHGNLGLVKPMAFFMAGETGTWGGFMPTPSEPNLQDIYSQELKNNKGVVWAFPVINGDEMEYFIPQKGGFVKGQLGILEPDRATAKAVALKDLNGILVPGVAFDESGHRMGRGRGFYDRYLSQFNGKKIGVCFDIQVLPLVPRDPHDVRMDVIITDERVLQISA